MRTSDPVDGAATGSPARPRVLARSCQGVRFAGCEPPWVYQPAVRQRCRPRGDRCNGAPATGAAGSCLRRGLVTRKYACSADWPPGRASQLADRRRQGRQQHRTHEHGGFSTHHQQYRSLQLHVPQPQRVANDRHRAELIAAAGHHRAEQQPKPDTARRPRSARRARCRRRRRTGSAGCCASSRDSAGARARCRAGRP